jgi:hypothetical protein
MHDSLWYGNIDWIIQAPKMCHYVDEHMVSFLRNMSCSV